MQDCDGDGHQADQQNNDAVSNVDGAPGDDEGHISNGAWQPTEQIWRLVRCTTCRFPLHWSAPIADSWFVSNRKQASFLGEVVQEAHVDSVTAKVWVLTCRWSGVESQLSQL